MSTRYATVIIGNEGEEIVSAIAQIEGPAPEIRSGKLEKVADGVLIGMVRGGPVNAVGKWGFPAGSEGSTNRSPVTQPKLPEKAAPVKAKSEDAKV